MEGRIKVHRLPREEVEGEQGGERERRLQALWRVHTNHPHFNVEYDNDDKREGGGGGGEEEGQWCVHGVPRDGGVC